MSHDLAVFKTAGLPTVGSLAAKLKKIDTGSTAGGVILKFDKTGCFVFGADATETEEDALWAVNPYSFAHGYIAWGAGQPLAEKMVPMTDDLPEVGAPPPCNESDYKGWQMQLGISLKCLTGEDAGLEVRYAATSEGGKKAVQALGLAVAEQIETDQTYPVPVVKLVTDSYQHKKFGKVMTPTFAVEKFVTMDGAEKAAKLADGPAAAASGRRRRPAAA